MKLIFKVTIALLISTSAYSQEESRLSSLKKNYDNAMRRVAVPLTKKYISELKRLKGEYTKGNRLEEAYQAQRLLDEVLGTTEAPLPKVLSEMTRSDFLRWLDAVQIIEIEGPYKVTYAATKGKVTTKNSKSEPRKHDSATVNLGRLFVPFTSTNATIRIAEDLSSATVTYPSVGTFKAIVEQRSE